MAGRSRRALVLDLDNTLWGGVIGDDGLNGITLGPGSPAGEAYQAFQAFVLELHRRGVVLAVSSKNEDAIARSAFREHPDMLIREQHISVFQANWTDKASNIRAIAKSLKLGLDSLVFVDDNPAECALVRKELPQVAVPHMGEEPALFSRVLNHSRLFEHLNLNLGRHAACTKLSPQRRDGRGEIKHQRLCGLPAKFADAHGNFPLL